MGVFLRIFLLFSLLPAWLYGQDFQQLAEQWQQRPALRDARLGLLVVDVENHEPLAAVQAGQALAPASSLKLLTTATALIVLGPDYRFKTELQMDGYLDAQGVLQGNLYWKGYGDPSLGSGRGNCLDREAFLAWLCERIEEAGIKGIAGDVLADATWFSDPPVPEGWSEKDGGNYYAAGVWALNFGENMYRLRFRQNPQPGGSVSILGTEPQVEGLRLSSRVVSGKVGSGDHAYIYGLPYDFEREVRGSIPPGQGTFVIKGSVPDAPLFAAQQLHRKLRSEGIPVLGKAGVWRKQKEDRPRELIARYYSPPLEKLVCWTNRESLNLYAEAFLRAIGRERAGEGSVRAGVKVLREVWAERGLRFRALHMADGSGLSANNRICAADLTHLVRKVYADAHLRDVFLNSLPVVGHRGTLKSYLIQSPAAGRIYAKTGSMKGVRSLTGYAQRPSGKWLAFSLIVNDYSGRSSIVWREMLAFLEQLALK